MSAIDPITGLVEGTFALGRLALQRIAARPASTVGALDAYRSRPPMERPQIFCAGSNYRRHATEMSTFNEGNHQRERLPGESDEDFYARNLAFVDPRTGTRSCPSPRVGEARGAARRRA